MYLGEPPEDTFDVTSFVFWCLLLLHRIRSDLVTNDRTKQLPIFEKNTVRTLPRLLHVDRLSSLSHCRGPRGPPKRSLCRLHRQLRTVTGHPPGVPRF